MRSGEIPVLALPHTPPKSVILSEAQRSRRTCHQASVTTLLEPFNDESSYCLFPGSPYGQKTTVKHVRTTVKSLRLHRAIYRQKPCKSHVFRPIL